MGGYQLAATLSSPTATVPTSGPITQDTITVQWATTQNGQPLANQPIQYTIQRASGTDTGTVTTNSQGQAQIALWTAHGQTMTITAQWTDPAGQPHVATVQPTWVGAPAPSPLPSQVSYHLNVSATPSAVQAGQPVTLTIAPMVDWTASGAGNSAVLANQTVQLTGSGGAQTVTTRAAAANLVPAALGVQGQPVTVTFTPTQPGPWSETATWVDPAGTTHAHTVAVTVAAQAPTCAPALVFDTGYPLPSWVYSVVQADNTAAQGISGAHVQPGCPVVVGVVTTFANNQTQRYVLGVAGVQTAQDFVQALANLGWGTVQVQGTPVTGTLVAQNGQPAFPLALAIQAVGQPSLPTHFTMSPFLSAADLLATNSLTQVSLNGQPVQVFDQGSGDTAYWSYLQQQPASAILADLQSALSTGQVNSYVLAAGVAQGLITAS